MKTESNPTSSARQAKSRSAPGANCSAEALYPSLINAAPGLARLRDEHGFCFGNVKRGDRQRLQALHEFLRAIQRLWASASRLFWLRLERPRGTSSVAQRQDFQIRSCASTP